MTYSPKTEAVSILDSAWEYVQSVPYKVTARWIFYRLLQDGTFSAKSDYKKLIRLLAKARKEFYLDWTPDILTDDTREAIVRGSGWDSREDWLEAVMRMDCTLDKWDNQQIYIEVWFEADAMSSQFRHYTQNIPVTLLAFHGDVSIPVKWDAAKRILGRMKGNDHMVKVLYYGDLDPKGIQIPKSAYRDIQLFIVHLILNKLNDPKGGRKCIK